MSRNCQGEGRTAPSAALAPLIVKDNVVVERAEKSMEGLFSIPLDKNEITDFALSGELLDVFAMAAQNLLNHRRGAIPATYPDYLGRRSHEHAALVEVRVFGDDNQTVLAGVVPHLCVGRAVQPNRLNVSGTGVSVRQQVNKPRRQVLVEEQPHAFDASCWRSRSAA